MNNLHVFLTQCNLIILNNLLSRLSCKICTFQLFLLLFKLLFLTWKLFNINIFWWLLVTLSILRGYLKLNYTFSGIDDIIHANSSYIMGFTKCVNLLYFLSIFFDILVFD